MSDGRHDQRKGDDAERGSGKPRAGMLEAYRATLENMPGIITAIAKLLTALAPLVALFYAAGHVPVDEVTKVRLDALEHITEVGNRYNIPITDSSKKKVADHKCTLMRRLADIDKEYAAKNADELGKCKCKLISELAARDAEFAVKNVDELVECKLIDEKAARDAEVEDQ